MLIIPFLAIINVPIYFFLTQENWPGTFLTRFTLSSATMWKWLWLVEKGPLEQEWGGFLDTVSWYKRRIMGTNSQLIFQLTEIIPKPELYTFLWAVAKYIIYFFALLRNDPKRVQALWRQWFSFSFLSTTDYVAETWPSIRWSFVLAMALP